MKNNLKRKIDSISFRITNERKYIHDTKKFGQLVKESDKKRHDDINKVYMYMETKHNMMTI